MYNAEKYIGQCLDSVIAQTYQNFEIIIIDDGSTDQSGKICDQYALVNPKIRVIHQQNQGPLLSRVHATKQSSGDFCLYPDADDFWDPELLMTVSGVIAQTNSDLIIFNYKNISADSTVVSEHRPVFKNLEIFNATNKEDLIYVVASSSVLNPLWCKAMKRNLLHELDYEQYRNIFKGEDLLQSIPVFFESHKTVYIDKSLYNYRILPTSISHKFRINFHTEVSIVKGVLMDYIRKFGYDSERVLIAFYQRYLQTMVNQAYDIMNSQLSRPEKYVKLREIQNDSLFVQAAIQIDHLNLAKIDLLSVRLIKTGRFLLLLFYSKILKNFI